MAKSNSTLILALAAAGAAGAVFYTRQAKAKTGITPDTTPADDDVEPVKPVKPVKPVNPVEPNLEHATFGKPYEPGNVLQNVKIAVATKPTAHPTGNTRGTKDWGTWLTNVVYWETYPAMPVKIVGATTEPAKAWNKINVLVKAALKPTTTTPKGHPTIGEPYRPGRANEGHNVATAVEKRPTAHPVGLTKGSQTDLDWLTNVAFWESYPLGPVKITNTKSAEAKSWIRIRDLVQKAMGVKSGDKPEKKNDKKKEDGLFPSLGAPYRPGSDQESANAALAVANKPKTHPRGETQGNRSTADWLTNVAYWETWPVAPTKIADPKGGLAASWKRIHAAVTKALAATPQKTTPTTTPKKTTPTTTPKKTTPTVPDQGPGVPGDLAWNVKMAIVKFTGENDRVNNAYYWTWPTAPKKIPKGDKANAAKWLEAQAAVRKMQSSKPATTKPATKTTPTKTTPATYRAGDFDGNLAIAAREKPLSHGGATRGKAKLRDWLANVVYWTTWPTAPKKIPKGDKTNAAKWMRAYNGLASFNIAGETPRPPATPTLGKLDPRGAEEVRNAAFAVDSTETGPDFIKRAATAAFHETYPENVDDDAHRMAAHRILSHVQRGAVLARKLGEAPQGWPHANGRRWVPFAIALACSSGLRSPEEIREAVARALKLLSGPEVKVSGNEDPGSIIAQTAEYVAYGKPLRDMDVTNWPASRAYMACADML